MTETKAKTDQFIDLPFTSRHSSKRYGKAPRSPTTGDHDTSNARFTLRLHLPHGTKPKEPYRHLMVLLHGFGEIDDTFYAILARRFGQLEIPTVLFPLPNHFSRHVEQHRDPSNGMRAHPKHARAVAATHRDGLINNPCFFPRGFSEIIPDLGKLLQTFENDLVSEEWPLLEGTFSPTTEVSFLGYSLGGLVALAATIYFSRTPSDFDTDSLHPVSCINSCIVLSSGLSMQNVDAWRLFMHHEHPLFPKEDNSKDRAQAIAEHVINNLYEYHQRTHGSSKFLGGEDKKHLREVFEMVFLGDHSPLYRRLLALNAHRILFILGGGDEVFRADLLSQMKPTRGGLAHLEIPNLSHWFAAKGGTSLDWSDWSNIITRFIIDFLSHHPNIKFLETANLLSGKDFGSGTLRFRPKGIHDVLRKQKPLSKKEWLQAGELCIKMQLLDPDSVDVVLRTQEFLNSTNRKSVLKED